MATTENKPRTNFAVLDDYIKYIAIGGTDTREARVANGSASSPP
jgi:hypothetical protein